MDYEGLIGLYFGESSLAAWLAHLGIRDTPRLERGEDTAYLSNKGLGIELTFEDSESLDEPDREYPDGALVLVNIRFYGTGIGDFSPFDGELPRGLEFGVNQSELVERFGRPDWVSASGKKLSWEKPDCWFQVNLDKDNRVEIVSLQRPM